MSPYDTRSGEETFAKKLRSTAETCANCGFEGTVLGSEWRTEAHEHPKSGHVVYRLRCPNCNETTEVEVNLP